MDINDLSRLFKKMQGECSWKDVMDPAAFPRHVEITDDRALLEIARMELAAEALADALKQCKLAQLKAEVAKEELYALLEKVYPTVAKASSLEGGGVGYRSWEGKKFFVSWGEGELPDA